MLAHESGLYRTAQVRAFDARAMHELGIAGDALMRRAAAAALAVLRRRWPAARRLLVACGPGNNGGDGFRLALAARAVGLDVTVLALAANARGDAALARMAWEAAGGGIRRDCTASALEAAEVVVDGLFGSGLSRPLEGTAAQWVQAINASGRPVLALDVPSGLDADSGQAAGPVVRAAATTCFVAWKRGLFTGRARDCCGALSLHRLELPAALYADTAADAELLVPQALPPRRRDSHKGSHGHVLVIGGEAGTGGAVRLAGEACLRAGAGLVSVATRPVHVSALLAARPELMVRGVDSAQDLAPTLARASVLLAGPGMGHEDWAHALWRAVIQAAQPLVLDADGLNLLAAARHDFTGRETVLTPHPGEAARLLGVEVATVQQDRFAAARALAVRYQAVVVLKGAGSLVASTDGRVVVCRHGNPGMATGGMGDVLGGIIAALMAQHLDAWSAACLAVDVHARAGDRAAGKGERGLLASDLFAPLRALLNGMDD